MPKHLFQASLNFHVPFLLLSFKVFAFLQERCSLHISLQNFLYSRSVICNHLLLAVEDVNIWRDCKCPWCDVTEKGCFAMTGMKQYNDIYLSDDTLKMPCYCLWSWLKIHVRCDCLWKPPEDCSTFQASETNDPSVIWIMTARRLHKLSK